jgi:short-subunit dehydrogenase
MADAFRDKVFLITGASSGMGRLTALRCAERGGRVVLASRNDSALNELANEIRANGGEAMPVPVDVSQRDAVDALVEQTVTRYGRIDVLINVAGVSVYGRVSEIPVEELEQVIATNLLGTIYTTKAVLPVMMKQGSGHILNFGSVLARRAIPLQSAYCASKFGVKGFTDALRMEMMEHAPGIHVTLVLPASINTPFFEHARSRMGVRPMPVPPVYQPEVVVDGVLRAIERPERAVYAGDFGIVVTLMENLLPRLTDRMMVTKAIAEKSQKTDEPTTAMDDSFDQPRSQTGRVHGDFGSLTIPAVLTPVLQVVRPFSWVFPLATAALAVLMLRRR